MVETDTSLQTPCPDVKPSGYKPHTDALMPKPGLMTGDGDMASTFPLHAKADQMIRSTAQTPHSKRHLEY